MYERPPRGVTSEPKYREKRMAKDVSKVKTIPELVARNQLGRILERVKGNKEGIVVPPKGRSYCRDLGI